MKRFYWLVFLAFCGMASPSVLTVTSTGDNGPGSLRQAIADAHNGDIIRFDGALSGRTIALTTGELIVDKNIIIVGLGAKLLTVSRVGTTRFRIFNVLSNRSVIISGLTVTNGYADASIGGGVLNEGVLTLRDCTVTDNLSDAGGGGGGLYSSGELIILGCTISSNRAGFNTGLPLGYGGGILSGGVLTIINSTISGNVADIDGGGIMCYGTVTIHHSTIADNRAGTPNLGPGDAGGIYNGGALLITSTILKITGGFGATIVNVSEGTVQSRYDLANDPANGLLLGEGDQVNVDPMLGPLADNGGSTFTHRPLNGSPAIDAGSPLPFAWLPETDQTGNARISGNRIDIGSLERPVAALRWKTRLEK